MSDSSLISNHPLSKIWEIYLEMENNNNNSNNNNINNNKQNKHNKKTAPTIDEWLQTLVKMFEFKTVEDFWCWFDNSSVISQLNKNILSVNLFEKDLSLFIESSDFHGRIVVNISIKPGLNVDKIYLDLLLLIISGKNTELNQCGGIVFKYKKKQTSDTQLFRFELWIKQDNQYKLTKRTIDNIKETLETIIPCQFEFKPSNFRVNLKELQN